MSKTLHVLFDGKVLRPKGPTDLKPDTHYVITIQPEEPSDKKNLWDTLSDLSGTVEGPEDWAKEHDHHLYGTPKNKKVCKL